jgi:hypothetical protein
MAARTYRDGTFEVAPRDPRSNIDHGAEWSKDNMIRAEIGGELDTKSIEST